MSFFAASRPKEAPLGRSTLAVPATASVRVGSMADFPAPAVNTFISDGGCGKRLSVGPTGESPQPERCKAKEETGITELGRNESARKEAQR